MPQEAPSFPPEIDIRELKRYLSKEYAQLAQEAKKITSKDKSKQSIAQLAEWLERLQQLRVRLDEIHSQTEALLGITCNCRIETTSGCGHSLNIDIIDKNLDICHRYIAEKTLSH
ncbi:MAG: hypothetical protein AB1489_11035 [Acidobacteriota bacterium]